MGSHTLRALSQLAQLGVIELGRRTTLTEEHTANTLLFAEELLQGKSAGEIGKKYGFTERGVQSHMDYWHEKAGFDTKNAYILHFLAAGAVGDIVYRPNLVEELPTLSLAPACKTPPRASDITSPAAPH